MPALGRSAQDPCKETPDGLAQRKAAGDVRHSPGETQLTESGRVPWLSCCSLTMKGQLILARAEWVTRSLLAINTVGADSVPLPPAIRLAAVSRRLLFPLELQLPAPPSKGPIPPLHQARRKHASDFHGLLGPPGLKAAVWRQAPAGDQQHAGPAAPWRQPRKQSRFQDKRLRTTPAGPRVYFHAEGHFPPKSHVKTKQT